VHYEVLRYVYEVLRYGKHWAKVMRGKMDHGEETRRPPGVIIPHKYIRAGA